ncbi:MULTISPECIES: hypothetical protein [unclassified Rickettsia]
MIYSRNPEDLNNKRLDLVSKPRGDIERFTKIRSMPSETSHGMTSE